MYKSDCWTWKPQLTFRETCTRTRGHLGKGRYPATLQRGQGGTHRPQDGADPHHLSRKAWESWDHVRQETDGVQAEQQGSVPCGQILQDKADGRSRGELSPARVRGKETTYFSFSKSRRPFPTTHAQKSSLEVEKGGGATPK